MICKSLESFVTATHGAAVWDGVRRQAGLSASGFEAMLSYEDRQFGEALQAASTALHVSPTQLLEDIGTWICTHPPLAPVRRLFRFSGTTFRDLLMSLDEIDARARMAVPELELPVYHLSEIGKAEFEVQSTWCMPGASGLMTGALRAMADDYGVLAMIEAETAHRFTGGWLETVSIRLVDEDFHVPKAFSLGGQHDGSVA
ncbi:MAG: heme NO-binding domain-containing protein [Jannaschia sp.]